MDDVVLQTLAELVPGGVRRGELRRGDRALRWVEAGSGTPAVVFDAGLAEPGSLAWAGVLPAVAAHTRVIAYDRAGVGASDPMSPLTLDGQIDDLTALLSEAGGKPCVLAGHSWGGLLADLAALSRPDLVAGMVLVDPAHEETLAGVPLVLRWALSVPGYGALLLHSLGLLGPTLRRQYRPFAQRVTEDPRLQSLILEAYVSCFTKSTQVRMLRDENRLGTQAISRIRQIRADSAPPRVPVVVYSATTGLPKGTRDQWTKLQAKLTGPVAGSEHIVAEDTGHAIHQERPEQVANSVIRVVTLLQRPAAKHATGFDRLRASRARCSSAVSARSSPRPTSLPDLCDSREMTLVDPSRGGRRSRTLGRLPDIRRLARAPRRSSSRPLTVAVGADHSIPTRLFARTNTPMP